MTPGWRRPCPATRGIGANPVESPGKGPAALGQTEPRALSVFENIEVSPASLPTAEDLDWQPLHPRYARRLQAGALAFAVPMIAAVGAGHRLLTSIGTPPTWFLALAWSAAILLCARAVGWPVISVPRRGYVVRERDIVYRHGVVWRTVHAVPFNRIQHTKTHSGPLDRRFGLATVAVYSAGAGGHVINGLGADAAEELRAFISARIESEAATPATSADSAE